MLTQVFLLMIAVRRDRFLDWQHDQGTHCAGDRHAHYSFECYFLQAYLLNRTAVLDDTFCQVPQHTGLKTNIWTPMGRRFNFERLAAAGVRTIFRSKLRSVANHLHMDRRTIKAQSRLVRLSKYDGWIKQMNSSSAQMLEVIWNYHDDAAYKKFGGPSWWYEGCDHDRNNMSQAQVQVVYASRALPQDFQTLEAAMRKQLGEDYCGLHVRRGDKAASCRWHGLAEETTGQAIMANTRIMTALASHGCTSIYLGTDEEDVSVFVPLFSGFRRVYSKWNFTAILKAKGMAFNDIAQLDYKLAFSGKFVVRTFKHSNPNSAYISNLARDGAPCSVVTKNKGSRPQHKHARKGRKITSLKELEELKKSHTFTWTRDMATAFGSPEGVFSKLTDKGHKG
jgi:hypothetical protein